MYTCICMCVYICVCVYIYIYIYTYTYVLGRDGADACGAGGAEEAARGRLRGNIADAYVNVEPTNKHHNKCRNNNQQCFASSPVFQRWTKHIIVIITISIIIIIITYTYAARGRGGRAEEP